MKQGRLNLQLDSKYELVFHKTFSHIGQTSWNKGCSIMPNIRRSIACIIAIIAGIFLFVSGIRGPTGAYELILDLLPQFIQDQQILQIATTVTTILITISLAGGLAVIAGGILILLNHVGTGKFIISLGTGSALPFLIMLVFTLATTQQLAPLIAEYSTIGWTGIILALAARIIAK